VSIYDLPIISRTICKVEGGAERRRKERKSVRLAYKSRICNLSLCKHAPIQCPCYPPYLRQSYLPVQSCLFIPSTVNTSLSLALANLKREDESKDVPVSSAHCTSPKAARSLTDPPGFMNSAFPKISHPVSSDNELIRIYSISLI